MSLSSLAREHVSRQESARSSRSAAAARGVRGLGAPEFAGDRGEPDATQDKRLKTALEVLTSYIPTETVTLYLAVCSTMGSLEALASRGCPVKLIAYVTFVLLTPLLLLLIYAGQRRTRGEATLLPAVYQWPWWQLIAATASFMAWGLAIPTRPFLEGPNGGAVFALLAIFVSVLLGLLAPIFEPEPASA